MRHVCQGDTAKEAIQNAIDYVSKDNTVRKYRVTKVEMVINEKAIPKGGRVFIILED